MRNLYISILAVATLLASLLAVSPAASGEPINRAALQNPNLPAPYSSWGVSLTPDQQDAHTLTLQFNSPLVGRRVTNTVYVPERYRPQASPMPVLYYLHGSVYAQLDNHALDPVTNQETVFRELSAGGGFRQRELQQFDAPENLKRAEFLTVAPDTDPARSWCHTCGWFDGRTNLAPNIPPATAAPVAGDSYLHQELYPLVEHLFNVRTDRGGRGVLGFSQGGGAALRQGATHSDTYAFVGSMSGPWDVIRDPTLHALWEAVGHYRDQGYGTLLTNPDDWHRLNPADLIDRFRGTGTRLLLSSGDACTDPAEITTADCASKEGAAMANTGAAAIELILHQHMKAAKEELQAKGIPATTVTLPGVHGTNNHRIYHDYVIPQANSAFASDK